MKTLKLNETQIFRLREAMHHSAAVLTQIRSKPLQGKALEDMKILEVAVQNLEVLLLGKV